MENAKRLIYAEDLLDAMPKNDVLLSLDVRRVILDAPTVDAVPVVRGRWDLERSTGVIYCSCCEKDVFTGLDADVWASYEPPFCPNCGAKMDLED